MPAALVALDRDRCPRDGATLEQVTWYEPALIRHGGYGATRKTVQKLCPACGWSIVAERSEVRRYA